MNSSPESAAVAFEYREPGRSTAASETVSGEYVTTPQNSSSGGTNAEQLDLKLAAARAEGFREGLQHGQEAFEKQLASERAKVAEAIRDFSRKTGDYYSRAEAEMVHLALGIAAKILHREAQVDRMLVAALVKVAMEKLQRGTTATVRVRPEEVADWNRYFDGNEGGEIRVEVKPDALVESHNCILETELGTTELGLDAQLKEVEQGFFDLLAQRPDQK